MPMQYDMTTMDTRRCAAFVRTANSVRTRLDKRTEKIRAFLYSPMYIYLLGMVSTILNLAGGDVFAYAVLGAATVFSLVVCPDALPAVASMIFALVARSVYTLPHYNAREYAYFDAATHIVRYIALALTVAAGLFHLWLRFPARPLRGCTLVSGYIALGAGLLLNGAFSEYWVWADLGRGAGLLCCMVGIYFLMRACVRPGRETLRYFAYICLVHGLFVAIQLCNVYLHNEEFIASGYDKSLLHAGWGNSNRIADPLFRSIPLTLYLMAQEKKHSWYYFVAASLMFVAQAFTFSRACLLITAPVFCFCYVLACIYGRNRKQILLIGLGVIAVVAGAVCFMWSELRRMLDFFFVAGMQDHGRFFLWDEAVYEFLHDPVFGSGLLASQMRNGTAYIYLHNTLLQFLGMGGLVGIGTFLYHRTQVYAVFTQAPTLARMYLASLIGGMMLISLLDCFIVGPRAQFFFCLALVAAESDLEEKLPFAYRYRKFPRGRRLYDYAPRLL